MHSAVSGALFTIAQLFQPSNLLLKLAVQTEKRITLKGQGK